MKIKHKRILALLLLAAMVIGIAPSVLAVGDSAASSVESAVESSGESAGTQEASSAETDKPRIAPPEATELAPVEEDTGDDDVPRSEDGETLTRDEELLAPSLLGISLFAANSTGTVSKSTCVNFAQYQSPTWYCNRYYTESSHVYGHYFYASTIAYGDCLGGTQLWGRIPSVPVCPDTRKARCKCGKQGGAKWTRILKISRMIFMTPPWSYPLSI